ncbi:MAG: D-alanine--D-alanine ligase family protein [Limnochordia bacterium]
MSKKMRVGLLYGGRSGEHEVSLQSGAAVKAHLDPERYDVIPIKIDKEGQWWSDESPVALLPIPKEGRLLYLDDHRFSEPIDVYVPILHGPLGEDGTIQGLMEMAEVAYVGSGVAASSVGMDKALMKQAFQAAGLPLLDYLVTTRREWERDRETLMKEIEGQIGYPCFVKPAALGSSVGISRVDSREELGPALDLAAKYHWKLIIEVGATPCQEVECSILGNEFPRASTVGEIVPGNVFYDYRAKYIDDNSQLIIPARIPAETVEQVRQMSIAAFQAIDGLGLARVDFFVCGQTVYLNEINTMPGFTRISMYPKLWEATGLSFSQLMDELIRLALDHHREKSRSLRTYEE